MSELRIIAGRYRHRRVRVVDNPALRPTPDRVRETLFNWLQSRIRGTHCLDLFAGTGILGLEALSRGATKVVCIEHHPQTVKAIRDIAADWVSDASLVVTQADAPRWLQQSPSPFDIVFLDPPFHYCDFTALLQQLQCGWLVAQQPLVYIESGTRLTPTTLPDGWELLRYQRAARVFYHLLTLHGEKGVLGDADSPE